MTHIAGNLELDMNELSKEYYQKPWNMSVPLETRMAMLKKYKTEQHFTIQDECEHKSFSHGICETCDYKCEHDDIEEGYCLFCGEANECSWEPDDDWRSDR